LSLASKLEEDPKAFSEAWNFGPRETAAISVEEVVSKIIKLWGRGKSVIDSSEHPHEANYLKLDLSKTSQRLKFKPVLEIDEAIQLTVQWYKNFYEVNTANPREYTINQIREYHKRRFGMLAKAIDKLCRTINPQQVML
jgi:CDP-glucose 4,6-dehydratase